MFRLSRPIAIAAVGALMLGAVAALVLIADPTPPAQSAISAARAPARHDFSHINFIDRFDTLDAARWAASDGWSNGDWVENDWRREQLSLSPQGLAITLAPSLGGRDKPYSSGEIATHQAYLYGYFEARMRVPRGDGVVTGLFTFTRPEGRASWHEIDMEFVGSDTRVLELAYHVEGRSKKHLVNLPFDAADAMHTYAFEWRPDAIRFFVDNQLVHEARGARVERMTSEQRFFVNLWNTESLHRWTGRIRPREAPWTLHVACVAQAREYRSASLCAPPTADVLVN